MSHRLRVVVLGGSGFVGRSLCARMVARGQGAAGRITVPTRRAVNARTVQYLPNVEPVQCNVHDDAQLDAVLAGQDAVVNLVAILHGNAAAFERVHVQLPQRLAAACARAGVQRLVHVSALGIDADAPSRYLRSKAGGEAAVRSGGVPWTVLRPSLIYGAADRTLNLFAQMQAVLPVVPLAAADARFQPVWVEDVAEAIVRCLHAPAMAGAVIECAGPKVYTLAELVRTVGAIAGRARPVMPLPAAIARLQAWLMELMPGEPLLSRDNLLSLSVPSVASGQLPGLESLGIQAGALEAMAPGWLAPLQGVTRFIPWRAVRLDSRSR